MAKTTSHDKVYGKDGMADGRYYHFVALREFPSNWQQRFWDAIGNTDDPKKRLPIPSGGEFKVVPKKYRSSKPYARGTVAETVSADGDGLPPYYYDLFSLKVDALSAPCILFGFPFASLALDLAVAALGTSAKSKLGEFCSVNVPAVVRLLEKEENKSSFAGFETRIVTMQVSVRDDKSLAAVRIGGENPLDADLYRSYLQERVEKGHLVPDYCVLACEKKIDDGEVSRSIRSRLHVDCFGNLKFYMQSGYKNLEVIGNAMQWFAAKGCLQRAEGNPVLKIDKANQLNE